VGLRFVAALAPHFQQKNPRSVVLNLTGRDFSFFFGLSIPQKAKIAIVWRLSQLVPHFAEKQGRFFKTHNSDCFSTTYNKFPERIKKDFLISPRQNRKKAPRRFSQNARKSLFRP